MFPMRRLILFFLFFAVGNLVTGVEETHSDGITAMTKFFEFNRKYKEAQSATKVAGGEMVALRSLISEVKSWSSRGGLSNALWEGIRIRPVVEFSARSIIRGGKDMEKNGKVAWPHSTQILAYNRKFVKFSRWSDDEGCSTDTDSLNTLVLDADDVMQERPNPMGINEHTWPELTVVSNRRSGNAAKLGSPPSLEDFHYSARLTRPVPVDRGNTRLVIRIAEKQEPNEGGGASMGDAPKTRPREAKAPLVVDARPSKSKAGKKVADSKSKKNDSGKRRFRRAAGDQSKKTDSRQKKDEEKKKKAEKEAARKKRDERKTAEKERDKEGSRKKDEHTKQKREEKERGEVNKTAKQQPAAKDKPPVGEVEALVVLHFDINVIALEETKSPEGGA